MLNNLLLFVADRGSLKAFRVEPNPAPRPPRLAPVQSLDLTISHGRFADKVTDQAGRFSSRAVGASGRPQQGGGGPQGGGTAEQQGLEMENSRRAIKQVAEQIAEVYKNEKAEGWLLAAPALMNSALVDELPSELRNRIVENVQADLVRMDASKLASHFQSLQRHTNA